MSRSLKKGPYIHYKLEKKFLKLKNLNQRKLLKLGQEQV